MKNNAQAMVVASFAADTLSLGAHWIYDTEKISREFGRISEPIAPLPESYHPTRLRGEFTHYGDQSLHLLKHLAEHQGHFSQAVYARDWQLFFADYHGYMDRATRTTLKNMAAGFPSESCGSPSTELGGAARIAPLIYCCRDDLELLLEAADAQTTITHTGSGVVDGARFIARSCYSILHGATPREAFEHALDSGMGDTDLHLRLRRSMELKNRSVMQAVKDFGQMCPINAALPGAVYTVLQYVDNLEEALIETVMAGGDSAARGMVVGMVLGAYHGETGIPERWLDAMVGFREIKTALEKLP
jgi:ADP-ribosylglycohydrolase